MHICHKCHEPVQETEYISRNDTCPKCGADLKCCLNCGFYEGRSYNQCTETQAERITDKEKANFCDYFRFREMSGKASMTGLASKKKGNPLDALFKK